MVVGASAPTLQDLHPTSYGDDEMSGPEIQANAIATVLDRLPLKSAPGWMNIMLILVLGMLVPVGSLKLALRGTLILSLIAAAGLIAGTQLAFLTGWINTFVYPTGALAMSSVGALGAHYLLAAFERERVHDIFARFVPPQSWTSVLERTDGDLRLGGVALEATVMFTDLRGFTTFSEALPADEVIPIAQPLPRRDDARRSWTTAARWSPTWATGSWPSSARRSSSPTTPTAPSPRRARCSRSGCRASTSWLAGAAIGE